MKKKLSIPFLKMQGTGNDFVVINNIKQEYSLDYLVELTPALCDRKFGVGADGLMALERPVIADTDYAMIYRNADGSDAGMCGNGSRCLALLAYRLGLGKELRFSVHDNIYTASVSEKEEVTVSFPTRSKIEEIESAELQSMLKVHTGTEHLVIKVSQQQLDNEQELVKEGRELRYDKRFMPEGVNVNFFMPTGAESLTLKTYEKGVENLTLACGTGAIAAALSWHHQQMRNGSTQGGSCQYTVVTEGGALGVSFVFDAEEAVYHELKLSGPAQLVFKGEYYV